MLTKRIIACLDVDGGRVVKGVKFLNLRDAGDPAELAAALPWTLNAEAKVSENWTAQLGVAAVTSQTGLGPAPAGGST